MIDDDLAELEAACLPRSAIASSAMVRSLPASIVSQLSPIKSNSSTSRYFATGIPSKDRSSDLLVSLAREAILGNPTKDIELVLSSDDEENGADVVVVGSIKIEATPFRYLPDTFIGGRLLSNSVLVPLKRPSSSMLSNRRRRIDAKRESDEFAVPPSSGAICAPSCASSARPPMKRNLLHYFGVFKEPTLKATSISRERDYSPSIDVVNLAVASNRFWCRTIHPFGSESAHVSAFEGEGMVNCPTLSRIPWKSLLERHSYVAALINPPIGTMSDLERVRRYLQPLTTRMMSNGGFLFWFVEGNFNIAPVVRLCHQWHFTYVESVCCVMLQANNQMVQRKAMNGAVYRESKISLLIFRKIGPMKLRHQRNVDVHFDIDKPWLKHHSRPYEYIYQLVETMIQVEKGSNRNFIEFWARPRSSRPGWTMVHIEDEMAREEEECEDGCSRLKETQEKEAHEEPLVDSSLKDASYGIATGCGGIAKDESSFILEQSEVDSEEEEEDGEEEVMLDDETLELVLSQREAIYGTPHQDHHHRQDPTDNMLDDEMIAWY